MGTYYASANHTSQHLSKSYFTAIHKINKKSFREEKTDVNKKNNMKQRKKEKSKGVFLGDVLRNEDMLNCVQLGMCEV